MPHPQGNEHRSLKDTSSWKNPSKDGKKGQPEGPALNSRTGKPWVAGTDRKTWNAAGQINRNGKPQGLEVQVVLTPRMAVEHVHAFIERRHAGGLGQMQAGSFEKGATQ
jgi:hypothetical protein